MYYCQQQQQKSDHFHQGVAFKAGIFWAHGARRAVRGGERGGWGGDGATAGHELLRSGCAATCIRYTEVKKIKRQCIMFSTFSLSFNTWIHHSVKRGDGGSTGTFSARLTGLRRCLMALKLKPLLWCVVFGGCSTFGGFCCSFSPWPCGTPCCWRWGGVTASIQLLVGPQPLN